VEPVPLGDGAHHKLERDQLVGGLQGLGQPQGDFVLAGAQFVVRRSSANAHLLKGKHHIPPGILAKVHRSKIAKARKVMGYRCRVTPVIQLKEKELGLGGH